MPPDVVKAKCARYRQPGKPWHRSRLQNLDDYDIVRIYGAEYRGVVNYYLLAQDVWRLSTLRWNAQTSMLKTLAAKHKSTVTKMAARHKAKISTGDGPRTCFEARRNREGKKDLVARFGGITPRQDRRAVIHDPAPVPVPTPRKELIHRLRKRRCELCETRRHGGSPPGRRAQAARGTRTGPARVGRAHGKNAAQDAHRLRALPRLHPREPRRARGINRWRAQCAERRTLGSEGGCAEKAQVIPDEPGTSPCSPPCQLGYLPADDGLAAAVVIELRTCSCCRGERPDPGRGTDCRAAARGSTTPSGCCRWHRASRGPVAVVPR